MGAVSGAFAAAATTPLDVIKTSMMCSAASRPTMQSAARQVIANVRRFLSFGSRARQHHISLCHFVDQHWLLSNPVDNRSI